MGSAPCSFEVRLPLPVTAPRRPKGYSSVTPVFWLWQCLLTCGEHGVEQTRASCKAALLSLGESMEICSCTLPNGSWRWEGLVNRSV